MSASDASVLHLTLGDHVHELDAAQQDLGATKILEAEHRPRASLDRPMILLDNIVQILVLANLTHFGERAIIAYVLETQVVSIVGVFYGGQNYEAVLAADDE